MDDPRQNKELYDIKVRLANLERENAELIRALRHLYHEVNRDPDYFSVLR